MKNIFPLLFILFSNHATAQEMGKNIVHWGVSMGIETQTLGIEAFNSGNPDETWVAADRNQPGISIGITAQKSIWKGLAIQSGLSLSFTQNQVGFPDQISKSYPFNDVELPVYFSVTNQKEVRLPLRAKVLFGPRFSWNFAPGHDAALHLYRERVGLDLGLGVEINLGKWQLHPEAIYSHGLNNLHDFVGTDIDFLVGRVVRDKLSFRVVLVRVSKE
jgi:hypothetical protein